MKTSSKKDWNRQREFLDTYIFKGLTDLNNGFDVEEIKYFSKQDFEVVLNRVEEYGLEIYGIELWKDWEYFGTKNFDFHYPNHTDAADPQWYRHAFNDLVTEEGNLQLSASYGIPETLQKRVLKQKP